MSNIWQKICLFIRKSKCLLWKKLINLGYTPTKHKKSLLQKTFGCVRFIYNYFLDRRIKAYEQNKNTISYKECSKELTQLKKKKVA